jgi:hypothetical protein
MFGIPHAHRQPGARRPGAALCIALSLASLLACLPAFAADLDTHAAAAAFVQQRHLGGTLPLMGYQAATRTVTFATLERKLGQDRAQTLVQQELGRALPDYQPAWDANLAAAYARYFTAAELDSLTRYGGSSPAGAKLAAAQGDVGQDMQSRSQTLLDEYVSQALSAAVAGSN